MSKLLGNALKSARLAKGLTQQQVAEHVGVSRAAVAQWERGSTEPSLQNLFTACDLVGMNVTAATSGLVRINKVTSPKNDEVYNIVEDRRPDMRDEEEYWSTISGNRGLNSKDPIPVQSVGLQADFPDGDFIFGDEVIDFVTRPPGVGGKAVVQAIYLPTASLSPRFEIGDIVFLSSSRWTQAGDDVVIEMRSPENEGPRQCRLRRLEDQTPAALHVRSFSPAVRETIERDQIQAIHRIIPMRELLGLR